MARLLIRQVCLPGRTAPAPKHVNFLQYGAAFLHNNLRQEET